MSGRTRRRKPRIAGRLLRSARRTLPLAMWLAAILVIAKLATERRAGLRATGFAHAVTRTVAPAESGTLRMLAVDIDDEVWPGQVLAVLDSDALDLRLAAAQAELSRLEAELAKEAFALDLGRVMREEDFRSELRRFLTDRDDAHIDVLKTRASIERDEVRLEGLKLDLDRLRAMDPSLVSQAELEDLQVQHERMATRIAENRKVLAQQQEHHRSAVQRAERFMAAHELEDVDPLLKPFEWSIAAQRVRLEEISLQRTKLSLRTPVNGRVASVLRRPGEVVAAGEPILTVVETAAREIVAYLPEEHLGRVARGQTVDLWPQGDPGRILTARVTRTGAMVEELPPRVDPVARTPRWGIPVYLACPEGDLIPGQAFTVVFREAAVDEGTRGPAATPR